MTEPKYPTWSDVGIPESIVDYVFTIKPGAAMDYLLLNKVYRFPVKAQFIYHCDKCGHKKKVFRIYEDYSRCDNCNSHNISSSANWRMGKDKIVPLTSEHDTKPENNISNVVQRVGLAYAVYFNRCPPDNFFEGKWETKTDKFVCSKKYKKDEDIFNKPPQAPKVQYVAKFAGGVPVSHNVMSVAIFRVAVLCPYLWVSLFALMIHKRKDKGQETHILPLFNLLSRLNNPSLEIQGIGNDRRYRRPSGKSNRDDGLMTFSSPKANFVLPKLNSYTSSERKQASKPVGKNDNKVLAEAMSVLETINRDMIHWNP